ncbi:hypothetical protein B0J13DRAFT_680104 [Dactylonectria estremocensis]|uniref:Uncharacterized protein n=1 Tax=Dactylonectria estremocensis TaxID=1079267 RepID=A0A9P9DR01_9HYPO|nr:hypothetical protein B0J13DRAFT_680104 [Dactylonectria estremocensis]
MLGHLFTQALAAQVLFRVTVASFPRPTSIVSEDAEPTHLAARQNSAEGTTITVAPDSVCGYLSPATQTDSIVACPSGFICSWGSPPYGFVFCDIANIATRCYPREEALDESLCDDVCRNNDANIRCTDDEALPYCVTYGFPDGIRGYYCGTAASLAKADFTSSGQTGRNFDTTVMSDEEQPTSTTGTTESTEATSTTSESSSTITQTETAPSKNDGGVPTGAIVGGVVGGLAVVSMLVLGILFLRRRSHNDHTAELPVDRNSMAMQHAGGPPPTPFSLATTDAASPATMAHSKHLSQASFPMQPEMHMPVELQTDSMAGQGHLPQWNPNVMHMPGPPHGVGGDGSHQQYQDLAILLLHHHSWLDTVSQSSFAEFVWLSQYGEQRLRYTDVQAVRAEIAIRVEDLPGYRVEERDDLAEDSVSRCKRVKIELPSSSFRALKAMRTPPPTPGQSVEANRCKASGVSLSPRLNTASQAKEPASQRPSSSNPTDLPSVALDYSNLLMNVAESSNSASAPSKIHETLRPVLADFNDLLDGLMKDASQAYEAANTKLNEKLAEYQELKVKKFTTSNDSVKRSKQAVRDAQGRYKALTDEADELDATANSLSWPKIHGKAPLLPQLRQAIEAYTHLRDARRWEARAEVRNIAGLEQNFFEVERLAKGSDDVLTKLKEEVSDTSKDSESKKAELEVLKNVKTMVLGVERTIPDLEKMAMP